MAPRRVQERKRPAKKTKEKFDAKHYEKLEQQIISEGEVRLEYADKTEANLDTIWQAWIRYTKLRSLDPIIALKQGDGHRFNTFWAWYLDHHKVKQESSLVQYMKRFWLLYKRHVGKSISDDVSTTIRNFAKVKLRKEYKLQRQAKSKPVLSADDVVNLLEYHWRQDKSIFPDERQRVQSATLLLLYAFSGQRPCSFNRNEPKKDQNAIAVSRDYEALVDYTSIPLSQKDTVFNGKLSDYAVHNLDENIDHEVEFSEDAESAYESDVTTLTNNSEMNHQQTSWCDKFNSDSSNKLAASDNKSIKVASDLENDIDDDIDYKDEALDDENDLKCLLYKHIKIVLLKPKVSNMRPGLLMIIKFVNTKGEETNYEPIKFLFWENENLLLCPLAHVLALAIHDQAFEAASLNEVRNLFRAKVERKECYVLQWRDDMKNVPVFRQAIRIKGVLRTSQDQPLKADASLRYLKRMGEGVGMEEPVTHYCVRRGTGNAIDDVATAAERDQVMRHCDSRIFRHYLNRIVKCDVQAAFLGKPSQKNLRVSACHMSLTADPNAPSALSEEQKRSIEQDPKLSQLRAERDSLTAELRARRLKDSSESLEKLKREKASVVRALTCRRKFLTDRKMKKARQDYFRYNDTKELEAQFNPSSEEDAKRISQKTAFEFPPVDYQLEERKHIVDLLFNQPSHATSTEEEDLDRRIAFIEALGSLCSRREARKRQISKNSVLTCEDKFAENKEFLFPTTTELFPVECSPGQCLICMGDESLPYRHRVFSYSTRYQMWDHIEGEYPEDIEAPMPCPHPVCKENKIVLDQLEAFQNHACYTHEVKLRPLLKPIAWAKKNFAETQI